MEKKKLLFIKLETTGLPDYKAPSDSESQPHIVRLCAILVNHVNYSVIAEIDDLVYPKNWDIPEVTTKVHGITTNAAKESGYDEGALIGKLHEMALDCDIVCHSAAFTGKILRSAIKRYLGDGAADYWHARGYIDVAKLAKDIVRVPAVKPGTFKLPTIQQAKDFFLGPDFHPKNDAYSIMCIYTHANAAISNAKLV